MFVKVLHETLNKGLFIHLFIYLFFFFAGCQGCTIIYFGPRVIVLLLSFSDVVLVVVASTRTWITGKVTN